VVVVAAADQGDIYSHFYFCCLCVRRFHSTTLNEGSQTNKQTKKEEESERKHVHLIR
jgi:hypothetical protein